jgi:hypothetical protein
MCRNQNSNDFYSPGLLSAVDGRLSRVFAAIESITRTAKSLELHRLAKDRI